ncbi:Golgi CORVET complex core vacuolar protein 8-domain-containing protein [Boeremia exigua]|uniref:Golgi CORVET complex core vacuolar protein 8-domain-containing protein n=1 Tax=Boeremia exigua TaxID=749465 RepID=UPI001E8CC063|nr:Golgi CORVET complex core vacuolar protein 8-domain-containing protein [Boeremia exigua]KAH6637875.1 Golgi CORVET complex core vacuolar protein 8-domain-containing protein [Boeremia exigua]
MIPRRSRAPSSPRPAAASPTRTTRRAQTAPLCSPSSAASPRACRPRRLRPPRGASPAFLSAHSRQSSVSSHLLFQQQPDEADTPQPPWEVVRWTKLKIITGQVFSEVGKRNFGRPTCLNVAASLVIGTSKGFILVFDYQQVLKSIIGPGTKAVECGAITALAISADHSTIVGGHATGHIFTWELAKPAKPFLHIPPLDRASLDDRKLDGHVSGVAILHLGFLGTRHTALVSADDGGMAFSHLATRGLGALARNVKITRILGRYPLTAKSHEKPRKPSSVLAFAPLPLGNVEQPTDVMGLTALLTPYLLVIVSTTPVAQTQHKAPRPKEVALHSAMSGCLAWFPAVKLKHATGDPARAVSKAKLVYCWSNVLTILDVTSFVAPPTEKEKPTELQFKPRSRWKADEAIVAVQWLSRSVLGVLTISQRLLILEDTTLRTTDSFDLLQKHIYHSDLFSRQLRPVVEQHDEEDASLHGVVADAFYMSFRAYKGRLFLLGFNDVSIGTLSNWADRLLALMEEGDFIAAIGLATSYYVGDADKLTVGLPEDDKARHTLVREKLLEMISASLKYAFAQNDESEDIKEARLKELAEVCFTALFSMKELDFLFEDVYEAFEEASTGKPFFETLEPYIIDGEIEEVPPDVLKDLITFYASVGRGPQVEEMICRLSTETLDINEVTTICQQYMLYDALIHVWTQTIGDFITPLTSILDLIKLIDFSLDDSDNILVVSARKIFPYLSYTFTGRFYPGGAFMNDEQAYSAKKDMYRFLFSSKNLRWPPNSGPERLIRNDNSPEPSFPYLHLILEFDASSFMSMLNEAFEDGFLNGDAESSNGTQTNGKTLTPTRQYIVNILLGIMTPEEFSAEEVIYFYMFIARNLPKYPQYIMLPGSSLHQILIGLCNYPTEVVKEDCQLSVEYLLTIYHPPNLQSLVPTFETAGFHRVLKSVYRGAQQYAKLVETYLVDSEDEEAVFGCISDILRPSKGLAKKQISEVKRVIVDRAADLVAVDAEQTAVTLKAFAPDLLEPVLGAVEDERDAQYHYLKALIEPEQIQTGEAATIDESLPSGFVEQYVQLMCTYNSSHVADFVGLLKSGDLKLDPVLPALEKSGVIDAAVVLLARDGLVKDAMDRLVKHLGTLETALTGLIAAAGDSPDVANAEETAQHLLEDIQKYVKVGIWLSQGQTKLAPPPAPVANKRKSAYSEVNEEDLDLHEFLWLDLITAAVKLLQETSTAITTHPSETLNTATITSHLRDSIQQTFSALLTSTTAAPPKPPPSPSHAPTTTPHRPPPSNPAFPRILTAFLTRASADSPTLSHLRESLSHIFATYAFEAHILAVANSFLAKESFAHGAALAARRAQGWRPRGPGCEGCGARAWGPGVGRGVWDAWVKGEEGRVKRREEEVDERAGWDRRGSWKGKGRSASQSEDEGEGEEKEKGDLVVFACRHLWHRRCVEKEGGEGGLRCLVCVEGDGGVGTS